MHSLPNIRVIKSRGLRWAGHVAGMETAEVRTGFGGGGPEGKEQLGIPRRRWKDNIRLDFQVVEWGHGLD